MKISYIITNLIIILRQVAKLYLLIDLYIVSYFTII